MICPASASNAFSNSSVFPGPIAAPRLANRMQSAFWCMIWRKYRLSSVFSISSDMMNSPIVDFAIRTLERFVMSGAVKYRQMLPNGVRGR